MSNTSDDACMKTKKDFAFNVRVVKVYVKKIAGIKNNFKKYADGIEFHKSQNVNYSAKCESNSEN